MRSVSLDALRRRHLRAGWWALLVFVAMGLTLEALHGWKARFYLDAGESTRRLLFTLCHAHGSFVSVVNIVFALCLVGGERPVTRGEALASLSFLLALLLLPAGFLLGGLASQAGDPGVGVVLVPAGGLALLVGIFLAARRQ